MSIVLHIAFAVLSLAITGVTAFKPTQVRLVATFVSIVLTVGSGVLLAVFDHTLITRVCTTGLTYLAVEVVAVVISVARLRVAARVVVEENE